MVTAIIRYADGKVFKVKDYDRLSEVHSFAVGVKSTDGKLHAVIPKDSIEIIELYHE